MNIEERLKDDSQVLIRSLKIDDLDKIMNFYLSLPVRDRKYLRIDVTDRKLVQERIRTAKQRNIIRIVAFHDDNIIADGRLELLTEDWRKNQAEIRLIVAREYQRKGLGMIMIRELYHIAAQNKVEKVIAKMMRPQAGARKIFRKLGFREEIMIPDYVRDQQHRLQDLIIMSCNMKNFWKELEIFYGDTDWRRCR